MVARAGTPGDGDTQVGQYLELFDPFDTFSHDIEAVRFRERDDRPDDGDATGAVEVSNEGLVDLQHGDRQARQMLERAVPGSEVVDRDPGAEATTEVSTIGSQIVLVCEILRC
jgi:hypothetical protein